MNSASASHNPLLPRPQNLRYGEGGPTVSGLAIGFTNPPNAEDLFAADQLASRLTAVNPTQVPVRKRKSSRAALLLNRKGVGAVVPGDKEVPGPGSRESYSVQVMTRGAVIRAPSLAGLFCGARTLLQMVEGTGSQAVLPVAEIRDWPELAYRGFVMGFSRGQLLRVSEIERQIDLLVRFKANQYYFYSEASIEFEGYELLARTGATRATRYARS